MLNITEQTVLAVLKQNPEISREEAVNVIAEDVAMVKVSCLGEEEAEDEDGMAGGILGGFFGKLKDTQVINAVEYKM